MNIKKFDRDKILRKVFRRAWAAPFVHRHFIYQHKPVVKCLLGGSNPAELYMHDIKKQCTVWDYEMKTGRVFHREHRKYKSMHLRTSDDVKRIMRRYRRNVLKIRKVPKRMDDFSGELSFWGKVYASRNNKQ